MERKISQLREGSLKRKLGNPATHRQTRSMETQDLFYPSFETLGSVSAPVWAPGIAPRLAIHLAWERRPFPQHLCVIRYPRERRGQWCRVEGMKHVH